jgi:hypothetical protein
MIKKWTVKSLQGKTFKKVYVDKEGHSNDAVVFISQYTNGQDFKLTHRQDCCECVIVEDVVGDLSDLENTPIVEAKVVTNRGQRWGKENTSEAKGPYDESWTWTFYDFRTMKGSVTIRFYGTSNGYYSEEVNVFSRQWSEYETDI